MKKTVLDYFPKHLSPRDVQKNTLLALEKKWDEASVFVVNLPVASGKSAIAMTLAKWRKKASILAPNKLLVDQYKEEYNAVHVLRAKSDYFCDTFNCSVSKRPGSKKTGKLCKKDLGCRGCTAYLQDLRKARVMPYLLSNYHIYLSHRLYRDTLIVDEAHMLIDTLKQFSAKKLWKFKYQFPDWLETREDIKRWVNKLPPDRFNTHRTMAGELKIKEENLLTLLKEEVNSYRPRYLISVTSETYGHSGESHKLIKLMPVDISAAPPIMWPSQVKKIVLLSATISRKDIEQLGLAGKKIQYIQADSPIARENRPIIVPKERESMAYRVQGMNISKLQEYIQTLAHNNHTKGLVHATYSLSKLLRSLDWDPEIRDRLIFHDKGNKTKKYNEFRDSGEPKILIASGMYEGIDLPYDAGRWQVLAKIPWPSLADPAIKWLSEQDDEWYAWEAIKSTLQACGRICRKLDDYGETFIFDKTFIRLYNNYSDLFPDWFKQSVRIE